MARKGPASIPTLMGGGLEGPGLPGWQFCSWASKSVGWVLNSQEEQVSMVRTVTSKTSEGRVTVSKLMCPLPAPTKWNPFSEKQPDRHCNLKKNSGDFLHGSNGFFRPSRKL